MHEELVKRLNTRLAVGDALDAALPGWEGDYPDAIMQLASERDEARARATRLAKALIRIRSCLSCHVGGFAGVAFSWQDELERLNAALSPIDALAAFVEGEDGE